jgi:urease accessory protein
MQVTHTRRILLSVSITAWLTLHCLAAPPAWAHIADGAGAGWQSGFAHPFSGAAHLLAMLAVGLWAARLGPRAIWLLPAIFPAFMALGAALSLAGIALPGAEDGVAISVAMLGVLLAVATRPPLAASAALAAIFALFHGYAQGTAMPLDVAPLSYCLGFLAAAACCSSSASVSA